MDARHLSALYFGFSDTQKNGGHLTKPANAPLGGEGRYLLEPVNSG